MCVVLGFVLRRRMSCENLCAFRILVNLVERKGGGWEDSKFFIFWDFENFFLVFFFGIFLYFS